MKKRAMYVLQSVVCVVRAFLIKSSHDAAELKMPRHAFGRRFGQPSTSPLSAWLRSWTEGCFVNPIWTGNVQNVKCNSPPHVYVACYRLSPMRSDDNFPKITKLWINDNARNSLFYVIAVDSDMIWMVFDHVYSVRLITEYARLPIAISLSSWAEALADVR